MQRPGAHSLPKMTRSGFLLIELLIVCFIVFLLYFHTYTPVYQSMYERAPRYSDPNILPWDEWLGVNPEKPYPEQPQITKTLRYEARVQQYDEPRGQLKLAIKTDGTVTGSWYGEFDTSSPAKHYNLMTRDEHNHPKGSTFKGRIAPARIYSDGYGQDLSLLYFVTRGRASLVESDLKNRRTKLGDFWASDFCVTGWIDTEYNIEGQLHLRWTERYAGGRLTKTKFAIFYWTAAPLY